MRKRSSSKTGHGREFAKLWAHFATPFLTAGDESFSRCRSAATAARRTLADDSASCASSHGNIGPGAMMASCAIESAAAAVHSSSPPTLPSSSAFTSLCSPARPSAKWSDRCSEFGQ